MDNDRRPNSKHFDYLAGGGEMGERMRALDWTRTPLGPVEGWPQSLKTIVRVMLDSRYAMWMLWGRELTFFCNDAYLPTVGMKRDWVLGARSDKVWEEIWPDIGPRIQRVLEEGRATWDEGLPLFLERYGFPEESYHTFSYSPIYDDGSRIAGMLCVVTEVTDRVIGERRLRVLRDLAASPRAETTEEACTRLINVLAGNPRDVSFASLYLLDQAQERLKLAHYYGNLPEQFLPAQISVTDRSAPWPIGEAIRSGAPQIVELPRNGPASITAPLWPDRIHQAMVLPIKGGFSTSIAVLIAGVSPRRPLDRIDTHIRLSRLRRAAGEHIRASEERLRIAIDEAGMATWDYDLRTHELRWSRSHYSLLGLLSDESNPATYQMWRSRVHPADLADVENALQKSRDSRSLYSQEYRIIRADTGAVRWLRVLGRYVYDESGAPTRSVGVLFDDTDRKSAEIALREADRRKDVFLATLAHELCNPLAPIRNAAQMLASPQLGSEQLQWARSVIQRQVKHMALLLDDLLDVARITQGKLELKKQQLTLNGVVDSAVEAARPLLDRKSHRFTVTLPSEPITLDADPLRLSQVLCNLLTNAAKYTDAGGRISLSGRMEDGGLCLSIKDNGIGIPAESLDGIFTIFFQVEDAAARSEGGLGIGLALVHGLVELHGGTVEAKSDGLGQGSEFIVRLPIISSDSAATPLSDTAAAAPVGRRILVADDNQDAADSLAMLLEMDGHDVRVAHDGRAALSVAQTFHPNAALLDIGMPQLNGYEVARALRQEPWGAGITLIALTGWGQESDRQKAIDAGFDHHLTKPIDPEVLETLMSDVGPLPTPA